MRITPGGDVVWARRTLAPMQYQSVTGAPSGTIFTAGRFIRTVTIDWPALLVARHEPLKGDLDAALTYGEAMSGGSVPTAGVNGDYLPAGLTPFDEANRIVRTPNGLFVSGNTAALRDVATLARLVLCLTERLSVRWWTAHDGAGSDDGIFDLAPTASAHFAGQAAASPQPVSVLAPVSHPPGWKSGGRRPGGGQAARGG